MDDLGDTTGRDRLLKDRPGDPKAAFNLVAEKFREGHWPRGEKAELDLKYVNAFAQCLERQRQSGGQLVGWLVFWNSTAIQNRPLITTLGRWPGPIICSKVGPCWRRLAFVRWEGRCRKRRRENQRYDSGIGDASFIWRNRPSAFQPGRLKQ